MSGIPIIGQILDIIEKAVDKIWPNADNKEELKAKLKSAIIDLALEGNKLIFMDLDSARKAYIAELQEQNVPSWIRGFRALVRPVIAFGVIVFYIYARVKGIPLTSIDDITIGSIVAFYFGLRHLEKIKGMTL